MYPYTFCHHCWNCANNQHDYKTQLLYFRSSYYFYNYLYSRITATCLYVSVYLQTRCWERSVCLLYWIYFIFRIAWLVSIRSADREYLANEVAEKLCDGIGSGGGHIDKAGGVISRDCICESYAGWEIADIIKERMEKIMK